MPRPYITHRMIARDCRRQQPGTREAATYSRHSAQSSSSLQVMQRANTGAVANNVKVAGLSIETIYYYRYLS
jgi:hypothetical protein